MTNTIISRKKPLPSLVLTSSNWSHHKIFITTNLKEACRNGLKSYPHYPNNYFISFPQSNSVFSYFFFQDNFLASCLLCVGKMEWLEDNSNIPHDDLHPPLAPIFCPLTFLLKTALLKKSPCFCLMLGISPHVSANKQLCVLIRPQLS